MLNGLFLPPFYPSDDPKNSIRAKIAFKKKFLIKKNSLNLRKIFSMIISLRFKNFFSLRDDAMLDFTADMSARRKDFLPENLIEFDGDKFVNIIGLFGSNAAGKSNIIKAMKFCVDLILKSHLNNEGDKFDYEPFKFDADKPSQFYIDFVAEGIEYEYSFALHRGKVIEEELFYYPNKRRARIFSRKNKDYTFGKGLINRPQEIVANTGANTLFLSRASSMNRPVAQSVYRFFLNNVVVGNPTVDFGALRPDEFDMDKELLLKAFEVSDSDIVDIRLAEVRPGQYRLLSYHRENPAIAFDFEKEESEGTKRLLSLLIPLLKKATEGASVFIDEFDLKLHLRLAEFLLDVVRASHGGQIVFTSHNPSLINKNNLRREQLVFVNKQADGNSTFIPLSDYEGLGADADIEKAYLQGRFDAVPYVGNIYPVLAEIFNKK